MKNTSNYISTNSRGLVKQVLRTLLLVSGVFIFYFLFMVIAGDGVLGDLEMALVEMQELDKKGLLSNPPETISSITKREIKLVHNSQGLRNYIAEVEMDLDSNCNLLVYTFITFIVSAIAYLVRLHFIDINLTPPSYP